MIKSVREYFDRYLRKNKSTPLLLTGSVHTALVFKNDVLYCVNSKEIILSVSLIVTASDTKFAKKDQIPKEKQKEMISTENTNLLLHYKV